VSPEPGLAEQEQAAATTAHVWGRPSVQEALDELHAWMGVLTDEEIADIGDPIFGWLWPGREAGHEVRLAWLAAQRKASPYPDGPNAPATWEGVYFYPVQRPAQPWIVRHMRAVHVRRGASRASRGRRARSTASASGDDPEPPRSRLTAPRLRGVAA
jgi:hypothetical protein